MALVMVTGLPCSGRTGRSHEMVNYFETKAKESNASPLRIVRLSNKDANIRNYQFSTQEEEKPARAAYLSMIMRNLNKNTIVIADGGAGTNIKGFRYQLWCSARETGVRCISVFCVSSKEACKQRNSKRQGSENGLKDEEPYEEETLNELLMRFEEPNAMTRWDSPLFVVDCNPKEPTDKDKWEDAPLETIWEAVTKGNIVKAPDVVAPTRATTSNYLSLLESTTQLVLSAFQALASFGSMPEGGGTVKLSLDLPNSTLTVQFPFHFPIGQRVPTTAALQRLRRQFVKMHASGVTSGNEIGHALSLEGRESSISSQAQVRAQRKGLQVSNKVKSDSLKPKSTEEELAQRFIVYLEETLSL